MMAWEGIAEEMAGDVPGGELYSWRDLASLKNVDALVDEIV